MRLLLKYGKMTRGVSLLSFSDAILLWYDEGHRPLPWRSTRDPYRIWVSEIMLQQTKADTVKEYYLRFLDAFPDIFALASAPEDAVLKAWEGLGYYSRARNLQKAAKLITETMDGHFPRKAEELKRLPGIGDYTAGAVASIAFEEPVPAVDGNVIRVLSRCWGIRENVSETAAQKKIHDLAAKLVPADRPGDYANAMMELGAMVCLPKHPHCDDCPVQPLCNAHALGDAEQLPIKKKQVRPQEEHLMVLLLVWQNRIVLEKRNSGLLKNLYGFPCLESETLPENPFSLASVHFRYCGHARHIFSHRIWEMDIHEFHLMTPSLPDGFFFCDYATLSSFPIPTAFRMARKYAEEILSRDLLLSSDAVSPLSL